MQKYGYKSWDTDVRQEVKLASGSVNMTLGQIMSLYATWKREHTLGPAMSQHLQNGGFYVEEYDPRKGILGRRVVDLKAHRVTEADMAMVNGLLTDEQKKFVDDIVAYMSTDMSELGKPTESRCTRKATISRSRCGTASRPGRAMTAAARRRQMTEHSIRALARPVYTVPTMR